MKWRPAFAFFALILTIASFVLWGLTGREVFTKQTRITDIERPADPDDIMDFARADSDGLVRETVREDGYWFGLLPSGYPRPGAWGPAPEWWSVASVAGPAWALALGVCVIARRGAKPNAAGAEKKPGA